MAYLIIEKGVRKGDSLELTGDGQVVVGRSEKADFQIPDRFVSRTHFAVKGSDDRFTIHDLDSDNGTFVNGEAIEREVLEDGDHIQIGETYLSFVTEESRQEREDLIGQEVGGYDILERIGRGGMGTVYKARQISLDRIVALKILDSELVKDEKFVDQFFSEARSAAQLNHPNVTKVFDVGEVNSVYYLSMEYISGGSLHDLLSEQNVLESQRATDIVLDIARALKFAKRKDLVHRDIKPANIMLTEEGQAKLIDLGIAKQGLKEWEEEDVMVGTPDYMAPEQATEQSVDTRADIYALGVTFYRMVTGERPIKGETPDEVIDNKFEVDPTPPRQKNKKLPNWMSSLIMDMIQKQPSRRVSSPQDVIDRIERGSKGGGRAKRSKKRQLAKRVSSNRWTLLFGAALVLGVLLGIVMVVRYSGDSAGEGPTAAERERANELLKKLQEQRAELNASPSKEDYRIAIQNHERFLSRYGNHKQAERVKKYLNRLRSDRNAYLLNKELSTLRQEFSDLKSSFKERTLNGVERIADVRQEVTRTVNRIRASISELQETYEETGSSELARFKQSLKTWSTGVKTALDTYRQRFQHVFKHIDQNAFRKARDVLTDWEEREPFQSEPYSSSIKTVKERFRKQERQYYNRRTNEIVTMITRQKFEQAGQLITSLKESMASSKYRNKLTSEQDRLSQRKENVKQEQRRAREREERDLIRRKGIDLFLQMVRRSVAPEKVQRSMSPQPEFKENQLYLGLFRFLADRYQQFYQLLGERGANFDIRYIEDPKYGEVRIINTTREWMEFKIPNPDVSATARRRWNELDVRTVLDLVFQNRDGLSLNERITLAAMYFLYVHEPDLSTTRIQSLVGQERIQLDQNELVSWEEIELILKRQNTTLQKFMVDGLMESARQSMGDGEYRAAWDTLQLIKSRYEDLSYFQSRSDETTQLVELVQSVVQGNGNTSNVERLVTWPLYIRPYEQEFERKNRPRIDRLLLKMNFRMEYEKRGRILLHLGRYDDAYQSFIRTLDDDWKQRLNTGKTGRSDESGTLPFYMDLYQSAILAGKSDTVRRDLRHTVLQLQQASGASDRQLERVRNMHSKLQEYQQRLTSAERSFVKARRPIETLTTMMEQLGEQRIPNIKKKYIITRSMREEFPDAEPVSSGDMHLSSARSLMKIGDYTAASRLLSSFPEKHPEHERARQIAKDGGMLSICKKHISMYNLR